MDLVYNFNVDSVDLEKVNPINQKRLLAFVNFWLCEMNRFLNVCANQYETFFMSIDFQMEQLEASLTLLELKLSSIPNLDDSVMQQSTVDQTVSKSNDDVDIEMRANSKDSDTSSDQKQIDETLNVENRSSLADNPACAKYIKMINMGVPRMAVEQKMRMEGLSEDIIRSVAKHPAGTNRVEPKENSNARKSRSSEMSSSSGDDASFSDSN